MKKIVLVALALIASTLLFAAKPLKVTQGSLDILRQDATASWTIDLSEATFEKDQAFKAWSGEDYETRVESMNEAFFESFNKYSKGLKLTDGQAPYKLVFRVNDFVRKQGPGMWGSMFITVSGTIDIVDAGSGEVLCRLDVDGVRGDTDFVENDRFPKTMDWLCRDIFKLKK